MSAQFYQSSSSASKPKVHSDGTITYTDDNGDQVQMAKTDVFNGLRLAGGEAFLSSSEDESSEDEGPVHQHRSVSGSPPTHMQMPPQMQMPMYAYAPSTSGSSKKSKKDKKEKKSKKSKKNVEYVMVPASSVHAQGAPCSCSGHRQ